jgi:hypothetical protein
LLAAPILPFLTPFYMIIQGVFMKKNLPLKNHKRNTSSENRQQIYTKLAINLGMHETARI